MRRRDFVFLISAAAMAPRALFAQTTSRRFLIGYLAFPTNDDPLAVRYLGDFLTGMRELGYTEGQDFEMVYRFADFHADRLPQLAMELVQLKPDVVGAATLTDPKARPQRREIEVAGQNLEIQIIPAEVRIAADIGQAYETFSAANAEVVVVEQSSMLANARQKIAEAATAKKLPTLYGYHEHVEVGGLVSYGVNLDWSIHREAYYVDKILKGAKPADLPVEFPTTLELWINMKAAKALGLKIAPTLLVRADKIIE
jgi:hypothetical protein